MVLVDKSVPTQHFYPDNNNKVVYSYSICKKDETRRWNEMRLTINNLNSVEEPKTTYPLNPQLHSRSATYIKRNGLLIRKITIKSSRPFQCAYHPLTP